MNDPKFYAYATITALIIFSVVMNIKNPFKKKRVNDDEHINMLPSLQEEDFGHTDSFL